MGKGFTLIELLAVITILALIAILTGVSITTVLKNTKSDLSNTQIALIKEAAKSWGAENITKLPNSNECFYLELSDLKESGFIDTKIIDADTNEEIPDTLKIKVSSKSSTNGNTITEYEVDPSDINNCETLDEYLLIHPVPEPKSFEEDDWKTIIANVRAGNSVAYKDDIGKEKEIVLMGSEFENKTYKVRLVNIESPEECEDETFSKTACGFVIEFKDIINTHVVNSTQTTVGGWEKSEIRTYLNDGDGSIFNALPKELQKGIIDTKVVSSHEDGVSENYVTTDKIYLLSTQEVWENGSSNQIPYDTARANTRQLDYYKSKNVTTNNHSEAIKNLDGNIESWWLRTVYSDNVASSCRVGPNGYWYFNSANLEFGVSPAFRLG